MRIIDFPIYMIGDLVLIKNRKIELGKARALQNKYMGPFIVIMRCSNNLYVIQDVYNPEIRKKVNIRLMKDYYSKNDDFLNKYPLPEKYLANIDLLERNSEDSSKDSDATEIYSYSEPESNSGQNPHKIPLNNNLIEIESEPELENRNKVIKTRTGRIINKPDHFGQPVYYKS